MRAWRTSSPPYRSRTAERIPGPWFRSGAGFAPRADRLTLYVTCDLSRYRDLLDRLGKHSRGKGCLHLRRLADADPGVLEELARRGVAEAKAMDVSTAVRKPSPGG